MAPSFSVLYFSSGTLPPKKGEKGRYWGTYWRSEVSFSAEEPKRADGHRNSGPKTSAPSAEWREPTQNGQLARPVFLYPQTSVAFGTPAKSLTFSGLVENP